MKKKPVVLMDANLLCWMAGESGSAIPKKFNLEQEKKAFNELLELRRQGKIDIVVSERHVNKFEKANEGRPELLQRIGEHYDRKIGIKHNIVLQDSALDQMEEKAFHIITNGKEKQDDPEFYLLAHFADPSITHVASCDTGLPAKFDSYNNMIDKNAELRKYRDFRKKRMPVFCGLPSSVLADLKANGMA